MRVSLLKYRLKEEDYMIFILKFKKDETYKESRYDDF